MSVPPLILYDVPAYYSSRYQVPFMIRNFVEYDTIRQSCLYRPLLNPFKTAVPLWGQTNQISSSLSPKRDWSPKRVNTWYVRFDQIEVSNNHIYTYHRALFTFVIKKRIVNTRTRACNWFLTLEIRIRTQNTCLRLPLRWRVASSSTTIIILILLTACTSA